MYESYAKRGWFDFLAICHVFIEFEDSEDSPMWAFFIDTTVNQSIKFISRSTCSKMNKKYIFHKLTRKRWKLKLATYKHFPFVQ